MARGKITEQRAEYQKWYPALLSKKDTGFLSLRPMEKPGTVEVPGFVLVRRLCDSRSCAGGLLDSDVCRAELAVSCIRFYIKRDLLAFIQ